MSTFTIYIDAAGEDETIDSLLSAFFQEIGCAQDIMLNGGQRMLFDQVDIGESGDMVDNICAGQAPPYIFLRSYICFQKFHIIPVRSPDVHDPDFMPRFNQLVYHVAAYEATSPRDHNVHCRAFFRESTI